MVVYKRLFCSSPAIVGQHQKRSDVIAAPKCFDRLPGTDLSRSGVPLSGTLSTSTSIRSIGHPIAFGSDSRTSTGGVVLSSSGRSITSTSGGVRATASTVAKFAAQAALNFAPVLRLGALLGEVTLLFAVAASNIVLFIVSAG
jgi:hypothetical protein